MPTTTARRRLTAALVAAGLLAASGQARAADAVVVAATAPGYGPGQAIPDGTAVRLPDGASAVFLFANGRTLTVKGPYDGTLDRFGGRVSADGLWGLLTAPRFAQADVGAGRSYARPPPATPPAASATPAAPCPAAGDPAPGDPAGQAVRLALAGCTDRAAALLAADGTAAVPLDLYLSTDRGAYPTYRSGEPVRLVLQTNREAQLYCYLRTARGALVPIFPDDPAAGARVAGHTALVLSDERLPVRLTADRPGTDQEVRCFALSADAAVSLPGAGNGFLPLDAAAVERLDRTLDGLAPQRAVMAQVILRVAER